MNKIELTDNELENILDLIISNNEYNDENENIDYWNSIIGKLDPARKFTYAVIEPKDPDRRNAYVTHSKGESL